MAKAPKPGSFNQQSDQADVKPASRFRITMFGTTLEMPTAISFKERAAVRVATGLPYGQYWGDRSKLDIDSLQVMWWLARRYNGESRLSLDTVLDNWPDSLEPNDVDFEVIEDDEEPTDDPES